MKRVTSIDAKDFIDELRFDIREHDLIKARLVLSNIDEVDEKTRKLALFEINRSDDEFAIPLLVDLISEHRELDLQYPQLREILYAKALYHPDKLISMLMRESRPKNRIVIVEIVGELNLDRASASLVDILNEENDISTIKAVVTALGMIGNTSATTAISEYLYSGDLELIIAAIHALGQLATPTAFQRLSEKLGADPEIDIMILDVFASSQSPPAIDRLNEGLSSHSAHIRNAAKQRLKNMGGKAVPSLIDNLLHSDDTDLLIHTLNVLGEIGDESAIVPVRKLLHNEPKNANVRFAAYEALGMLPVEKGGAFALAQGLTDPVENVRAVAASAIDRNYNSVLAAGLKNIVRSGPAEALDVATVVLNTSCDTIFLDLLEDETFQACAIDLLCGKVHPDITDRFVAVMRENGHASLAEHVYKDAARAPASKINVFAVDDSKMILSIYRGALHELGCTSRLFAFPAEALKAIADDPPHVIFTDLNMPEINGVELIREVRRTFDKNTLPIIMVTTQNESQDNDAAIAAGVNAILHKPFTAADLEKALAAIGKPPGR